jgi:hypothetical protein
MEEQWPVDRARLRTLRQQHPNWSGAQLAQHLHRSLSWVKKWSKRLKTAPVEDEVVLKSQSRRPKQLRPPVKPEVVKRILTIRDQPPEGLQRTPGPVAIKYYLHKMEQTEPLGCSLPTSTSTIWRILCENQRLIWSSPPVREPTPPAEPLQVWQIDFKDVTTVNPEPEGKRQHHVETLNILDTGTSILMDNPARTDFNAETVIETVAQTLQHLGCPHQITFDRDPRFVGSASSGDFPAAFVRFLACLDIEADICPPQQPQKNGFVESYNRTYDQEGIQMYRPADFTQVIDMNRDIRFHYNYQRPNQARSCGNQPPRLAFPNLPALPSLPVVVDPDHWLQAINGQLFRRRVNPAGTVQVDKQTYYIGRAHQGRSVVLRVEATTQQLVVELNNEKIKELPIKGLQHQSMSFEHYLTFIRQQAVSEWRHYLSKTPRYVRLRE